MKNCSLCSTSLFSERLDFLRYMYSHCTFEITLMLKSSWFSESKIFR